MSGRTSPILPDAVLAALMTLGRFRWRFGGTEGAGRSRGFWFWRPSIVAPDGEPEVLHVQASRLVAEVEKLMGQEAQKGGNN